MKYRTFGRTGWQVSEIGYGMWGMAGWTGSDDDASRQALQRAVELGCNFFDTAWAYGAGRSETLAGRVGAGQSAGQAVHRDEDSAQEPPVAQPPTLHLGRLLSARSHPGVRGKQPEERRLPSFDLMQLHTWEDAWLEDDRWITKLRELKSQGLIHAIGLSLNRWEPWNGVQAVASGLIDAVQVIYNIFDQNPQDELFPACREHNVAVIARVPFDEGTLTGTLTMDSRWPEGDWRNTYFVPENLKASVERADRLKPLVPAGMTMPDMALRFILAEPDRQHDHPRHAQGAARRVESGGQRRGAAGRRPAGRNWPSTAGTVSRPIGRSERSVVAPADELLT